MLVCRLSNALEEGGIIPRDFCAYRRARAAGEVGYGVFQSLMYAARRDERIVWISTDMEGAFENISRSYMGELLAMLGVGEKFIGILNCLWGGMQGYVSYGGVEQEPIDMQGRLTLGAPESALLFNVALIPLKVF